jgi:hypothetical protein
MTSAEVGSGDPGVATRTSSSSDETACPFNEEGLDALEQQGAILIPCAKSRKRKIREALLERKASRQRLDEFEFCSSKLLAREIRVDECLRCRQKIDQKTSKLQNTNTSTWCMTPVRIPPLDWPLILQGLDSQRAGSASSGLESCGIEIILANSLVTMDSALDKLQKSMQDGIIGVDLEWRPDDGPTKDSKVALIQLASATVCVLIRCKFFNDKLPSSLASFFADSSCTFVAFSWDSNDEHKMRRSFGIGKECFSKFIDLRLVAEELGYYGCGLATLTKHVLGVRLQKARTVSQSNWARQYLTPAQIQYAALDALLTGGVFRGLRLWHMAPSPCTKCRRLLGEKVRCSVVVVVSC